MAKGPLTPDQQAAAILAAEQRAAAVAEALEKLRNQLDPTRAATLALMEAQKEAAKAAKDAAKEAKETASLQKDLERQYKDQQAKKKAKDESLSGGPDETGYGSPGALVQRLGGQLAAGNLSGVLGEIGGSFGLVGAAAGMLAEKIIQIPGMLKGWADSAAQLTGVFSPLTSGLYTRAWRDLTASIGEQLMPVVQTATSVVRFLGDTIAGLTPIIKPLITEVLGAFKPVFAAVGDEFRELINSGVIFYEVMKPLAGQFLQLVSPLNIVTSLLKFFTDDLKNLNAQVALFLGIDLPKFAGASLGKAFVSVQTQSVSAMLQQVRQEAFKIGGNAPNLPQKQVDILAAILRKLGEFTPEKIGETLGGAVGKQIGKAVDDLLFRMPRAVADAVGDAVSDALDSVWGGGGPPKKAHRKGVPPAPADAPVPAPAAPFDPLDFFKKQADKARQEAIDKLPQGVPGR